MNSFLRRPARLLAAAALLTALALVLWHGNCALTVTNCTVSSSHLPAGLDGLRIAQVSDLHGAVFGAENGDLLAALRAAQPDLIAVTGDLIDSYRTGTDDEDWRDTAETVVRMTEIAPVYYVTGNHEARLSAVYPSLEEALRAGGVTVLRNGAATFSRSGAELCIWGVDDPSFAPTQYEAETMDGALAALGAEAGTGDYLLLLSHRPELLEVYAAHGVDLVLTGHAHGGQIRVPGLGGLAAPNQGLLPAYTSGLYRSGGTVMAVSRGLGNSIFPLRVNNPPEVVLLTLARDADQSGG